MERPITRGKRVAAIFRKCLSDENQRSHSEVVVMQRLRFSRQLKGHCSVGLNLPYCKTVAVHRPLIELHVAENNTGEQDRPCGPVKMVVLTAASLRACRVIVFNYRRPA